jgi:hypothetical protein
MKLERIATCLRPYGINGKKVHRIYFFNEEGVILSTNRGWLEKRSMEHAIKYGMAGVDIEEIELKELNRKLKKDFSKKQNFYIKAEKINDWESMQFLKDEYDLYIYVGDVVKVEKTCEHVQDEEGTTYINTVKYTEYKITGLTEQPFTMVISQSLKCEDTNEKKQAEEILQIIKDKKLYINISDYDLCKLLKVFNITKK